MNSGSMTLVFIAIFLSLVPHDMMYGPQAALIAESFTGRLRYSGASMGYQLASIIAGGPAPIIAGWLFIQFGSGYAIAVRSASSTHAQRLKDKEVSQQPTASSCASPQLSVASCRRLPLTPRSVERGGNDPKPPYTSSNPFRYGALTHVQLRRRPQNG